MKLYLEKDKEVFDSGTKIDGRIINVPKPNKGIYKCVSECPAGYIPFSWKVENDVAVPDLLAPDDWEEVGFPIRIKASEKLLYLPEFNGINFQIMFTIWLARIEIPSRNLPITKNHQEGINHVYMNRFTYASEEDELKSLSQFGWKEVDGVLYTGLATDEGMTPIYGNTEEGSLIEIQKIEELQP